jgi:hypothetical protein
MIYKKKRRIFNDKHLNIKSNMCLAITGLDGMRSGQVLYRVKWYSYQIKYPILIQFTYKKLVLELTVKN